MKARHNSTHGEGSNGPRLREVVEVRDVAVVEEHGGRGALSEAVGDLRNLQVVVEIALEPQDDGPGGVERGVAG